jgi:DNA-binding CsgD family transcriptional regulator
VKGPLPFVGRAQELARLRELVGKASCGESHVLVVRGEAGIGKTALLDEATRLISDVPILWVRCMQSEAEIAFGALSDLVRPIVHLLEALPEVAQAALRASLDHLASSPAANTNAAVGLSTLGLLAEAAPIVVIIDDAQWMDDASHRALMFAARRLHGEGVLILISHRPTLPGDYRFAELPTMDLHGLQVADARVLSEVSRGAPLSESVHQQLMRHTGGNPLAVIELARLWSDEQMWSGGGPPTAPERVVAAYRRRLAAFDLSVRQVLLICAAGFTGDLAEVRAALGERAFDILKPAEDAGLVAIGARVEFVHPLLRASIYHDATPSERRSAHATIAEALTGVRAPWDEQRAWHMAAAALGPDEGVASTLTALGDRYRRRGALRESYAAYARAGELSPMASMTKRWLSAATVAHLTGDFALAEAALDRASVGAQDETLRAAIQQARMQIKLTRSSPQEAFAAVSAAAGAAGSSNQAVSLWTTAAATGAMAGLVQEALAASERARAIVLAHPVAAAADLDSAVLHAHTLTLTGQVEAAREILDANLERLQSADPLQQAIETLAFAAMDLMWLDEHRVARALLHQSISLFRRTGALERLPSALSVLADHEARVGRWAPGYAAGVEARAVADAVGQPLIAAYALASMARIDAARGDEQSCRDNAEEAIRLLAPTGADLVSPYVDLALGQLALSVDRIAEAIDTLSSLAAHLERLGVANPTVVPYHADLVEAHYRAGQVDDARSVLEHLATQLGGDVAGSGRAALARCRGLLCTGPAEACRFFEEALCVESRIGNDFAVARTRLLYGERLRAMRKRKRAIQELKAAELAFGRIGAAPWSRRASGVEPIDLKPMPIPTLSLTPREYQVAMLAADGRTTREIATALFLSPKTVDYHLGHVYTKLGVRSRIEMVKALMRSAPPSGEAL